MNITKTATMTPTEDHWIHFPSPAQQKFALGELLAPPNVQRRIEYVDMLQALARHVTGDWGAVAQDAWQANDMALREGTRLVSVYEDRNGRPFRIITGGDRRVTTILLPEEN